jgi:glycosyltransferase involved in cell wall biosynthesis
MKRILLIGDAGSIHLQRISAFLGSQGHEVHVATFAETSIDGAKMHILSRVGKAKFGYLQGVWALRRVARQIQPDVCNAHYITSYGLVAALAGLKPLALTAWGSDLLVNLDRGFLFQAVTKLTFLRAKALILVAGHMRGKVERLLPSAMRVEDIPFGVDCALFNYMERLPTAEGAPLRLVSTRNLAPIYRIDTIIDAVAALVADGCNATLDVVGSGELDGHLRRSASASELGDKIRFLGRVEHAALPRYLQKADIFLTASVSDGNNVSLNEAMAAGAFPIASDIPANRQWITHGKNGLLFPVGDSNALKEAILQASNDPGFRASACATNRQIAQERADWNANARAMENLLLQIAGGVL